MLIVKDIQGNNYLGPLNYGCNKMPETIPDERNMYSYRNADKFRTGTYQKYANILGGHVTYYQKERPIEELFKKPNYVNNQVVIGRMYTDPMGSLKPEYDICQTKNNLEGQLTFIQDSTQFREELMAKQMRKNNQTLYERKWNIY